MLRLYLYAFILFLGFSAIAFVIAVVWMLVWTFIRLGIWLWIRMVDVRIKYLI